MCTTNGPLSAHSRSYTREEILMAGEPVLSAKKPDASLSASARSRSYLGAAKESLVTKRRAEC